MWAFIISSASLFVAYTMISWRLFFYIRKRHTKDFRKLFVLLSCVFFGCGGTHGWATVVAFWPGYHLELIWLLLTAAVSLFAVIMLERLTPLAMEIPQSGELGELHLQAIQELRKLRGKINELEKNEPRLASAAMTRLRDELRDIIQEIRPQ